jgi:hypothetical protein
MVGWTGSMHLRGYTKEIIDNTRGGIKVKNWERS